MSAPNSNVDEIPPPSHEPSAGSEEPKAQTEEIKQETECPMANNNTNQSVPDLPPSEDIKQESNCPIPSNSDQNLSDLSTPGCAVEVEADGEWWDAHVLEAKDSKVRVHYVGGTDDQDEWIDLASGRIRPPVKPEFVWATCTEGKEHPCAIVEGSRSDPSCDKLCVFSFLDKRRFWTDPKSTTAFDAADAARRPNLSSDEGMNKAFELACDAIAKAISVADILAMEPVDPEPESDPPHTSAGGWKQKEHGKAAGRQSNKGDHNGHARHSWPKPVKRTCNPNSTEVTSPFRPPATTTSTHPA